MNATTGVGILLVAFLIYGPALDGALLWDDPAHVTRAALRGWDGLWKIWFEPGATQQFYPVLHSAFWIEHRLWGDSTVGYHVTNVLLHALNASLLVLLLRLLERTSQPAAKTPSPPAVRLPPGSPWLAAWLLVVHPVAVESVAWISEQKNTLSTAFYLAAALAFLRFHQTRRGWHYVGATLLYGLALGTKTTTATLPAALLVVLWWKYGRLAWKRDVFPLLPWFAIAIPAGLLTAWVERTTIGADLVVPDTTLVERVLLAARILWFYIGQLVWPLDLTFFYRLWNVADEARGWVFFLVAAVIVTVVLWALRRRWRAPLALWLLYVGTLFPALGFFKVFPFSFSYVADHFQYLALPAALTAIAAGICLLLQRLPPLWRTTGVVACGALVLALAFISRSASALYQSDEVLFRANIAANPSSWMGHHILAQTLSKQPQRRSEAVELFRRALELNPRSADTHAALAGLLVREPGNSEAAIALFREAIRLRPTYAEAHNGLANELTTVPGQLPEAIEHYETALRLRPDFALAEANLAMALAQISGRERDALRHFEHALKSLTDYAPGHFYFARLLSRLPGRVADSALHYEKTLALRPGVRDPLFELAGVLLQLGRLPDAAARLEELLRLYPSDVEALNLRGVVLMQQGRAEQARVVWLRALELAPTFEPARRNLQLLESNLSR